MLIKKHICNPELVSGSLIEQISHKTNVLFEMLKQVQHDNVIIKLLGQNPTIAKSEQSNKTSKRQKPNLFEERK
ncbi:MAG: hypothetical protein DK841_00580 [Candidatus Melainabacteria bacterium]|nr:MAG: hypothetical protein DK841_00580 [Candidatus Melainabacteria bacterium]